MIQNIKTPSLEDLIDAFRSREKEQLDAKAATEKAKQDFWAAYEESKEPEIRKLHDLITRVFAPFIESGHLTIGDVVHESYRNSKENWLFLITGNVAGSPAHRAASVWRPNTTTPELKLTGAWRWSLPSIKILGGVKLLDCDDYKDWDEMTLALCEYAGKCLAHLDA